ncbi:MAG TPA: hypothetical protein VGC21_03690 [Telluria sp.]|jgi:hypothetical protein
MRIKNRVWSGALAACLLLPEAPSALGAPADPFPPPGLYRLDGDATLSQGDISAQLRTRGADGSGTLEGRRGQGRAQQHTLPASAPVTFCMPARAPNGGMPLPASSCRALGKPVVDAQGTTFATHCDFADLSTTVTRLDAKTWQYRTVSVERLGSSQLPDFATQRKMFEQTAKHGATPEERADAAGVLKDWDNYVAEARAAAAEQGAAPGPAAPGPAALRRITSVTRFTRIADSCGASAPRRD